MLIHVLNYIRKAVPTKYKKGKHHQVHLSIRQGAACLRRVTRPWESVHVVFSLQSIPLELLQHGETEYLNMSEPHAQMSAVSFFQKIRLSLKSLGANTIFFKQN